jgi:hypothetical protein
MGSEQRAKLLHFCTGASRPPAAGFEYLMGYMGTQARFKLQKSMAGSNWLHGALFCDRKLHSRAHFSHAIAGLEASTRLIQLYAPCGALYLLPLPPQIMSHPLKTSSAHLFQYVEDTSVPKSSTNSSKVACCIGCFDRVWVCVKECFIVSIAIITHIQIYWQLDLCLKRSRC